VTVDERLGAYAAATRVAMDEVLARGEPGGYLYELVREYPARAGKGLRPALVLASCEAFGGTPRDGLRAAVALELLHNAFLIHDDVEDGSPRRRGAPTLHASHGVALAVNAGDALAALALEPLLDDADLGSRVARRLMDEMLTMVRTTTEGQALELGWRRDGVVDLVPEDYVGLAVRKTCWYTTVAPMRLGAIAGSRDTAPLDALSRFGLPLGVAFQIRDDLLSLVGGNGHGKETLGDIREGKRTLMLIHLLAHAAPADRERVVAFLMSPEEGRTRADAVRILDLMDRCGSLDFARAYADGMAAMATAAFDAAFAPAPGASAVAFIRELIPYMVARAL
jgi:geranylgeranyl diphosphate synthase type II